MQCGSGIESSQGPGSNVFVFSFVFALCLCLFLYLYLHCAHIGIIFAFLFYLCLFYIFVCIGFMPALHLCYIVFVLIAVEESSVPRLGEKLPSHIKSDVQYYYTR